MGLREEGGDTGKKQWNTKVKTEPRVTQFFIKQHLSFPFLQIPFYRNRKSSYGESSLCGSYRRESQCTHDDLPGNFFGQS